MPLNLNPIDFVQLFRQNMAARAAAQNADQPGVKLAICNQLSSGLGRVCLVIISQVVIWLFFFRGLLWPPGKTAEGSFEIIR